MSTLSAAAVNDGLSRGASAESNLTAACRGILSIQLAPSPSPWYVPLNNELKWIQYLAQVWISTLAGTMQTALLGNIAQCGQLFANTRPKIELLFSQAAANPGGNNDLLLTAMSQLQAYVLGLSANATVFNTSLHDWGTQISNQQAQMRATIAQIQQQEGAIQNQIATINNYIAQIQERITNDRNDIDAAKSARTGGIVESIFGIVLAPFTYGASLSLTDDGFNSIDEAEDQIGSLNSDIDAYQQNVGQLTQDMTQDQAQIATLGGLTMAAGVVLNDVNVVTQLIVNVREQWDLCGRELGDVVGKLQKATTSDAFVMQKAWFEATCNEWALITPLAQSIAAAPASQ